MARENKGILLDLDGCVADSHSFWHLACREALSDLPDIVISDEQLTREVIPHLGNIKKFGHPNPPRFINDVLSYVELSKSQIKLHLGVLDVIIKLAELKFPIAIVTSSSDEWSRIILEKNGCYPYINAVISRDTVTKTKPHPEPLLKAISILKLQENVGAVMVGDSSVDTLAGKEADKLRPGVETVSFFPTANNPYYSLTEVRSWGADHIIYDFRQLLTILGVDA